MKVLYIGHFAEGSGWSNAAIANVLALDSVGVDVVPRTVKLGGKCGTLPKRFLELLEKDSRGADYCIQHVLPNFMVHSSGFKKCVGLYATETSNFINSGWSNYINLMDEAWVICQQQVSASLASGVNVPIKVVPHATDPSKYDLEKRKKVDLGTNGAFTFYTISEFNTRKNIPSILRAFHSEFDPSEDVVLLLKLNSQNLSTKDLTNEVLKVINKVKGDLRIFPTIDLYKGDLIETRFLSEDDLLDLHYSCDCFVNASFGEAFSIPTFEAMGFGKFPLVTRGLGCDDFIINGATGGLIDSNDTIVSGVMDTLPGLFTGKEEWKSISIPDLRSGMRFAYENLRKDREVFQSFASASISCFTYEKIGNKIKELLDE